MTTDDDEWETIWKCSYNGSDPKEYLFYGLNFYLNDDWCNKEAFHWIRKSAEGGYKEAYGWLSFFYYHGYGGRKDYAKAMYWGERGYNYLHRDPTGCNVSDIVKLASKKLKQQQQLEKEKNMNSKELKKEIKETETEIEELNKELKETETEIEELNKELKETETEIKETETEIEELNEQKEDAVAKVKRLKKRLTKTKEAEEEEAEKEKKAVKKIEEIEAILKK